MIWVRHGNDPEDLREFEEKFGFDQETVIMVFPPGRYTKVVITALSDEMYRQFVAQPLPQAAQIEAISPSERTITLRVSAEHGREVAKIFERLGDQIQGVQA